jgi:peptide/nickel transport system permease protein
MANSATQAALDYGLPYRRERPLPLRLIYGIAHFARKKPLGFVGAIVVLGLILVAIFADQLAPYSPTKLDLKAKFLGFNLSSPHKLGTDQTGRDVLSRLIYGARISMFVGFGAILISEVGAVSIGVVSGYIGGWFDKIVQRLVDAWLAMPGLIILITILGIAKRTPNIDLLWGMVVAIGILGIPGRSRVFRSQVLSLRGTPYVEASRCLGATPIRIMMTCMIPNVMPLVLVSATTGLGAVILTEASLSFLGFGPAGKPSWGQMLSVEGREQFLQQWGLAVWPGVCIGTAVFCFNIFGDALRDVLDPRLRNR